MRAGDCFTWVVPFLVPPRPAGCCVQPRIQSAGRGDRPSRRHLVRPPPYGLFAVGIYDGYFGAASGVMTLAVLMLTVETQLVRANAIKNTMLGVADVVAAAASPSSAR